MLVQIGSLTMVASMVAGCQAPKQVIRPEPGARWNYVALGDSTPACYGFIDQQDCYVSVYARHIERDLGVKVAVDNRAAGGAGFLKIQDALRNDQSLRNAVAGAHVITIWAFWLNDLARELSMYDAGACGGEDNMQCLREALPAVVTAIDGVITEVLSLRSGAPTIIRIANVGNPFVAMWQAKGAFEPLKRLLVDSVSDHIKQIASRQNIAVVDSYTAINGLNGDRQLESRYMQADGLHFNAEGHALIADLHRQVGYAPFVP